MTTPTANYPHLRQSLQHYPNLPEQERVLLCLEDVFIDYPSAKAIIETSSYMLKVKRKVQAPCMLVWGSGGFGKTSIIRHLKAHNKDQDEKLVFMSLRQNPNNYNFRELLFEAFGLPIKRKFSSYDASKEFTLTVERQNIRGIVIDEIHDALTLTAFQQKVNLSLLKNLSGDPYNLSVFAFGIDKASEALRLDPQLERRYMQWPLPKWSLNDDFRSFLAGYERVLPLKMASNLWSEESAKRLFELSAGLMDAVAKVIQVCAAEAILSGAEKITVEIIDRAPLLAAKFGVSILIYSPSDQS
ncbi:TniB family NTP-binding protein [Pseudomonas abietaniphila]|jgi:GTPase SAR1 family protein